MWHKRAYTVWPSWLSVKNAFHSSPPALLEWALKIKTEKRGVKRPGEGEV